MTQIYELYQDGEAYIFALLISLPRIYAFLLASSLLNRGAIPGIARNGVIMVLCLPIVAVNHAFIDQIPKSLPSYALFYGKEFLLGFFFGYLVGWLFWTLTAVGDLIDNQRGAAIAASIDPLQGTETSPLGHLMSQGFLTYIFAIGGFLTILGLFYKTYVLWPVTKALPTLTLETPKLALEVMDYAMELMFVIAMPIVAVMFLAEFALALVSRFAPQIQVFILAMPIKSAIAIFMLIIYVRILFPFASEEIETIQLYFDRFLSLLQESERLMQEGAL